MRHASRCAEGKPAGTEAAQENATADARTRHAEVVQCDSQQLCIMHSCLAE